MKWLLALLTAFALHAAAADISGNWKATAESPNGTIERTFVFKVDGAKLTGETSSQMMGKSTITDGKIDGDNVSFTITVNFQGSDVKLNYKGKVSSDQIKFTVEGFNGGASLEWVAKRT
jgi:hypothetical protein